MLCAEEIGDIHASVTHKERLPSSVARLANALDELNSTAEDGKIEGTATFIGCRPRNREVLQRRMYRTEIEEWMREADMAERHQLTEHTSNENEHLIASGDAYQRPLSINS
uniref:Uncharacterized protein n=1 Tax=Timema monikensis TaxID=170555 RepID=A0A7R9E8Q7_9NEOP|nr:unnamed protein product [Timema monikensis]